MSAPSIVGYFDGASSEALYGWVHVSPPTGEKLELDIIVDGRLARRIVADQYRKDLDIAGIADPSSAFWVPLSSVLTPKQNPDEPYVIAVQIAGTSVDIPGSPREVLYQSARPEAPVDAERNILPNASFKAWPHGLVLSPAQPFTETAQGWYVDFRKGTSPKLVASVEQITGVGALEKAFGLRIRVDEFPPDTYVRLVVPLAKSAIGPGTYHFGCGIRPPSDGTAGTLSVREIFVGQLTKQSLSKVSTLRRNLVPRGTMRLRGLPVSIDQEVYDALGAESDLALTFDLTGTGELILFEPILARQSPRADGHLTLVGSFEDKNIHNQIGLLKLSPIWKSGTPASGTSAPLHRRDSRTLSPSAIPFTQVVIPVFNAIADVEECVRSILESTTSPFEIILADDGSDSYTQLRLDEVATLDPRIRVIRNEHNLGYTRNINKALQTTSADYVILLNSDTIVTTQWIERLHEAMLVSPDTAAVGPLSNAASWQSVPYTKARDGQWAINALSAGLTVEAYGDLVHTLSDAAFPEFPLLNGFCTMFRRAALDAVEYFADDAFPQGYGEENDLCLRLTRSGHKLRVADHCYIYHKKSKSFGHDKRRELSKAANDILKHRHPTVAIPEIEELMRTSAPINALRRRLLEHTTAETELPADQASARAAG